MKITWKLNRLHLSKRESEEGGVTVVALANAADFRALSSYYRDKTYLNICIVKMFTCTLPTINKEGLQKQNYMARLLR